MHVSFRSSRSQRPLFLFATLLVLACGCEKQIPSATITGSVSLNGKPIDGSISFENIDGKGRSDGAAIKDGRFRAEKVLYGEKRVRLTGGFEFIELAVSDLPGAPTNKAVVDAVPSKYNAESELKISVDQPTIRKDFELEFEPASSDSTTSDVIEQPSDLNAPLPTPTDKQ